MEVKLDITKKDLVTALSKAVGVHVHTGTPGAKTLLDEVDNDHGASFIQSKLTEGYTVRQALRELVEQTTAYQTVVEEMNGM